MVSPEGVPNQNEEESVWAAISSNAEVVKSQLGFLSKENVAKLSSEDQRKLLVALSTINLTLE